MSVFGMPTGEPKYFTIRYLCWRSYHCPRTATVTLVTPPPLSASSPIQCSAACPTQKHRAQHGHPAIAWAKVYLILRRVPHARMLEELLDRRGTLLQGAQATRGRLLKSLTMTRRGAPRDLLLQIAVEVLVWVELRCIRRQMVNRDQRRMRPSLAHTPSKEGDTRCGSPSREGVARASGPQR
jgi:hypothetical protein